MFIKIKRAFPWKKTRYAPGQVVEVEDKVGRLFIKGKLATETDKAAERRATKKAESTPEAPKPAPAPKPTPPPAPAPTPGPKPTPAPATAVGAHMFMPPPRRAPPSPTSSGK